MDSEKTFLESKTKKLGVSGAKQGGSGEEYIADPAPKIKKGKRSNDVPGADRVGKKRTGLVTNATSLDCASSDHPSTNELSLLKQIIKRKSEINMQGRKREKNSHTEPHQEVALSVAELLVVDTEDGLVARKRKTARDGDLRSVRMSEAEEKSAKFAERKK